MRRPLDSSIDPGARSAPARRLRHAALLWAAALLLQCLLPIVHGSYVHAPAQPCAEAGTAEARFSPDGEHPRFSHNCLTCPLCRSASELGQRCLPSTVAIPLDLLPAGLHSPEDAAARPSPVKFKVPFPRGPPSESHS